MRYYITKSRECNFTEEVENNKFAVHICKIERCITDGKPTASKGKAKNFSVNTIIQNGKQIGTFIFKDKKE